MPGSMWTAAPAFLVVQADHSELSSLLARGSLLVLGSLFDWDTHYLELSNPRELGGLQQQPEAHIVPEVEIEPTEFVVVDVASAFLLRPQQFVLTALLFYRVRGMLQS